MNPLFRFYGRHYLRYDAALSVVAAAGLYLVLERYVGVRTLQSALDGNRSSLYSTLTQVGASLLGFVMTAVPILHLFSERRSTARLRAHGHFTSLYAAYFQAI